MSVTVGRQQHPFRLLAQRKKMLAKVVQHSEQREVVEKNTPTGMTSERKPDARTVGCALHHVSALLLHSAITEAHSA